ncbi:MAG: hypothetical protein ACKV2T_08010 [Kofleriaceae bacterium]
MRRSLFWVVALLALAGCDQVFSLERPPDAAPDAPPPPPEHCSAMSLIEDDFERTSGRWGLVFATIQNGRVEFGTEDYPSLASEYYYDLRDNSFAIDLAITDLSPTEGDVRLRLAAEGPPTANRRSLDLVSDGALLIAQIDNGEFVVEVGRVAYNPTLHATWRIVHDRGMLVFEAGAIGGAFETVGTAMSPDWVGFMNVVILVARPVPTSFTVTADNAKGGTRWDACRIQYLTDRFSDGALDQKWARSYASSEASFSPVDGVLEMTAAATTDAKYIFLRPSALQDLRGGRFVLQIPMMVDTQDTTQRMEMVVGTAGGPITITQAGGTLQARRPDYTLVDQRAYDPVEHQWWQIREAENTLYWEVSRDGQQFTTLASATNVANLDQVGVALSAQTDMSPRALRAQIDNVGAP